MHWSRDGARTAFHPRSEYHHAHGQPLTLSGENTNAADRPKNTPTSARVFRSTCHGRSQHGRGEQEVPAPVSTNPPPHRSTSRSCGYGYGRCGGAAPVAAQKSTCGEWNLLVCRALCARGGSERGFWVGESVWVWVYCMCMCRYRSKTVGESTLKLSQRVGRRPWRFFHCTLFTRCPVPRQSLPPPPTHTCPSPSACTYVCTYGGQEAQR